MTEWLEEKMENWNIRKPKFNPTQRKACPECGSSGRHKKSCSRSKKK